MLWPPASTATHIARQLESTGALSQPAACVGRQPALAGSISRPAGPASAYRACAAQATLLGVSTSPTTQPKAARADAIGTTLLTGARDLTALLRHVDALAGPLQALADTLIDTWHKGGKLLVAGNGGSAAEAMHLAEELTVRYRANRRALAAIALCDPTALTCAGNDFSFESIFSRQVEALGRPGDVLMVLSTSGNSANLVRAVAQAKQQQLITTALLGKGGGQLAGVCDIELIVPSDDTARIQEIHQLLFHTLCDWIDQHYT